MIAATAICLLAIAAVIGWCYAIEAHQRATFSVVAARLVADAWRKERDRRTELEAALHGGDPAVWAGLRATERETRAFR
jgi:hypothetical protein